MSLLLACFLLISVQDPTSIVIEGVVNDIGGKGADEADVFLSPSFSLEVGGTVETLAHAKTNLGGRFRLEFKLANQAQGFQLWAYKPGRSLGHARWFPATKVPNVLQLMPETTQQIRIIDVSGKPVSGLTVYPWWYPYSVGRGNSAATFPTDLALKLAGTTDAEGRAEIKGTGKTEPFLTGLISSPEFGVQPIPLKPEVGKPWTQATVELAGSLSARVVRSDGQSVESITAKLETTMVPGGNGQAVTPPGGPIKIARDGTFRTPECLLANAYYRLSFQGDGIIPATTAWSKGPGAGKNSEWPPLTLGVTRTVSGRIVDRQGAPLANVEVIQAGDGPKRTTTKSGSDGRFRLGGYFEGPALVVAHAPGFRYGGRLVVSGDNEIVLTRISERPERILKSLSPPATAEELKAICRKLLARQLDDPDAPKRNKDTALFRLIEVDPIEALHRYTELKRETEPSILRFLVPRLYATDREAATGLLAKVTDNEVKAQTLLGVIDSLPNGPDPRKQPLLEALVTTVDAGRDAGWGLLTLGETAERLVETDQIERAKPLFAEGLQKALPLAPNDPRRINFAVNLSRIDVPTSLELIRQIPNKEDRVRALQNAAFRIAEHQPQHYERLREAFEAEQANVNTYVVCARIARTDPELAIKLVEEESSPNLRALDRLAAAWGMAQKNPTEAENQFHKALEEAQLSDELIFSRSGYDLMNLVEEINPELVQEYLWFAAQSRFDARGNRGPELKESADVRFASVMARYDREISLAFFTPIRERFKAKPLDQRTSFNSDYIQTSAYLDPASILELIESLPDTRSSSTGLSRRDSAGDLAVRFYAGWLRTTKPRLMNGAITMFDQIKMRDTLE